jgi:hypothetical protein
MQWRTTLPLYDFVDTNTGEHFSTFMKISEKETFLQENPHVQSLILGAPALTRGSGGIKNDNGWKENLSRIAEAHPNSALANKVNGGRTSQQVLVDKAKNKAGLKEKNYTMDL